MLAKPFGRGAVALLAFAVLFSGCAPASPSNTPATSGGAAPGTPVNSQPTGKFTYGAANFTPSMDPALSVNGTVRKWELFETLTYADQNAQLKPMLASKWESVDATTWRFSLRTDAKFQDGSAVTAKDVEFTWNRAIEPALKAHVPGNLATVASVAAEGTSTVVVKTKIPDPVLPRRFFFLAILPQAAMEKVGEAAFWQNPIGSGPFKFKEFVPDNRLVLTAWPEHPYRKPKIAELTVRLIPEASARVTGLRTGDLDAAMTVPLDAANSLKNEGYQSQANNLPTAILILDAWGTDGTDAGPVGKREVRLALNYAIDREAIAKTIWHGIAKPAKGILSEGVFGYDASVQGYTYDPAKAKQYLAQAGYPNGFKTTLEFQASSAETQATLLTIQAQLKDIGIEVDMQQLDGATVIDKIYKRKQPAPLLANSSTPAPLYDGDGQFAFFHSKSRFGTRYSSAKFDELYDAQQKEMDPVKRESLLKELGRVTQDDPPLLLIVSNSTVTVWNKNVNLPAIGGDNVPFFDLAEKR